MRRDIEQPPDHTIICSRQPKVDCYRRRVKARRIQHKVTNLRAHHVDSEVGVCQVGFTGGEVGERLLLRLEKAGRLADLGKLSAGVRGLQPFDGRRQSALIDEMLEEL